MYEVMRFWDVCYVWLQEASYEYIKNEAERTLLEAMDAMEIAFSHGLVGFPVTVTLMINRQMCLGVVHHLCIMTQFSLVYFGNLY